MSFATDRTCNVVRQAEGVGNPRHRRREELLGHQTDGQEQVDNQYELRAHTSKDVISQGTNALVLSVVFSGARAQKARTQGTNARTGSESNIQSVQQLRAICSGHNIIHTQTHTQIGLMTGVKGRRCIHTPPFLEQQKSISIQTLCRCRRTSGKGGQFEAAKKKVCKNRKIGSLSKVNTKRLYWSTYIIARTMRIIASQLTLDRSQK